MPWYLQYARTTILGYNFSAPFFISPAARADYAHPEAEVGLVKGAYAGNILYMVNLYHGIGDYD